jgi:hypothetical protein|tara:strand:- start:2505 stop:3599 length:1095 start_codon:yes stop_codon:yes gene_type:complete
MEKLNGISIIVLAFIAVYLITIAINITGDAETEGLVRASDETFIAQFNQAVTLNQSSTGVNTLNRYNTTWLDFDGVNDYVEIPDADVLTMNTTGEITISFWMQIDSLDFENNENGYVNLLGKGATSNYEWYFRIYNQSHATRPQRISVYIFNTSGGTGVGSYVEENLSINNWTHIVGVINSTHTAIYRDGVFKDADDYSNQVYPNNTDSNLTFGRITANSYFNGSLDRVRIYNSSLTESNISDLYSDTFNDETNLVGRWNLNENSGLDVFDSASSNDGTINGSTGATWDNDDIDLTVDSTNYTVSGSSFTLSEQSYSPTELRINYNYRLTYLGLVFLRILQIILAVALLLFVYLITRHYLGDIA